MTTPITRAQANASRAVFLLDLSWAGGELSIATEAVSMTDTDGQARVYQSGLDDLEVSLAEAVESVKVSITMPEAGWLEGFRRGYPFDQMRGTLSRYYIGTVYEARRVLVSGVLIDVEFGSPGAEDTLSASLTQAESTDRTFPDRVINTDDLSGIGSTPYDIPATCPSLGLLIPIIFGAPGRYKSGLQIPAVPALELTLTEDSAAGRVRWIIASHHLTGFVVNSLTRPTTAGRIYNLGGSGLRSAIMGITTSGAANPMMLHNATDHKGNEVAFVENNITSNYGPFSAGDVESGGEFWFGFTDQQVGGLANPYRDGLLDGCSDVVRYILERYSGQRVDTSRMEAEAADLNNLKIDCVINAATTATKWIESLANVYPLRMVQGPDGVYVKRRRYTADRSQAVAALATKGQSGNIGVSRRSGLVLVEDEIYNSIRVEYAPRKMGQDYQASVTVGASEQVQTQLTAGTVGLVPKNIQGASRVAEGSQASYGLREKVVSAPTCFDESTAAAIGVAMAERYAMPRYAVTYTGDRSLETLNPGDVVTIADPDLTDNRRLAIVDDVVIGSRQPTVVLELVSDPIAWTVSTG